MDKYHGVYVKIVLNNNDTVKGHIYGKDESGNLILRNVTTEHVNGYKSQEDMLPIVTTLIKDLEVLDMNTEKANNSNNQATTQAQAQGQAAATKAQEQEQLKQQELLKQQQQFQQHQQQHFHQMQQQMQQMQQPPMFPMPPQYPPFPPHQPSPHMLPNTAHLEPAMLFHHHQQQQQQQQLQQMHHSPLLNRDPAIISSQEKQAPVNGPKMTNLDPAIFFSSQQQQQQPELQKQLLHHNTGNEQGTKVDPAILFSQKQEPSQQQNKRESVNTTTGTAEGGVGGRASKIDPAILFSQNLQGQPQQQQQSPISVQNLFQQQHQQNENTSSLKSLDPSILFQQQHTDTSKPLESFSPATALSAPFQDPAIIRAQSTPAESSSPKKEQPSVKKPLFGTKKAKKPVKEVVVFEDYSEFETGKGGAVKKVAEKTKKTAVDGHKDKSNNNSNTSTPNIKKQQQNSSAKSDDVAHQQEQPKSTSNKQQKPHATNNSNDSLPATTKQQKRSGNGTTATISTPPIEILSRQSSSIPASLIPPKARRSGSSSSSVPLQQQQQSNKTVSEPRTRILTVSGGVQIPTVTYSQMENAKRVARETGLTQTQLIENGAFGISMMVLKAIGGHRRIQPDNHNAAPVVVILAGPTSIGEFGIAAARHLANRGCQVIISIVQDASFANSTTIEQYKALAQFSGARIVSQISELPNQFTTPVDIIVDALLGSSSASPSSSEAIKNHIHWANVNKAPVLSIDFPSGLDPNHGLSIIRQSFIQPKWTLCLGAPYIGCTSRNVTGELFLADAGLPSLCFQEELGHFHIPWGSDFVLALEYAS